MSLPRVLLVDDDRHALAALARLFGAHCGVRILAATSPDQALDYLNAARFELIVTDYNLPGLTGVHLLALCLDRWPDMRRAIYTGDKKSSVDFADAILMKGDNPVEVVKKLCELARTPRA